MITHTATRLGNGEVLLKTIWEGEDERVTIHTSSLSQEQAAKLCKELWDATRPSLAESLDKVGLLVPPDGFADRVKAAFEPETVSLLGTSLYHPNPLVVITPKQESQ